MLEVDLKKGHLVTYFENDTLNKGIVVANNSCVYFSSAFQVVPIEIINSKMKFYPKKEFLIQRSQIQDILGRISLSQTRYIEKGILKHHLAKSNDVYQLGEVSLANLPKIQGMKHCQYGYRPVLIYQCDNINKMGWETTVVIPISTLGYTISEYMSKNLFRSVSSIIN